MADLPQTEQELRALNAELRDLIKQGASASELAEARKDIAALKILIAELREEKRAEDAADSDAVSDWKDEFDAE